MRQEQVGVVIPTLNEAGQIKGLVDHLVAEGFAEIIVADGGSVDQTCELVEGTSRVKVVRSRKGRGYQLHHGMQHCSAPLILLLHADTRPPLGAVDLIRATLARPQVAAGCFRLAFDTDGFSYSVYSWLSRFETPMTTFGDQGFFARRSTMRKLDGIPRQPLFEDVELRRRFKTLGQFVKVNACVVTSARRFKRVGAVLGQVRNTLLLLAYNLGVSPEFLYRLYDLSSTDEISET